MMDRAAMEAELAERRARPVSDHENGRAIRRLRQALGALRWRDDPPGYVNDEYESGADDGGASNIGTVAAAPSDATTGDDSAGSGSGG